MIPGRVVAEERQAEAAFALERAVARPGVAAHAAEQAHDVALEVHFVQRLVVGQANSTMRCRGGAEQSCQRASAHNSEAGKCGSGHSLILRILRRRSLKEG